MSYGKGKTEGGHKRGHSNSGRWVFHQEAKATARKQRRIESGRAAKTAITDPDHAAGRSKPHSSR